MKKQAENKTILITGVVQVLVRLLLSNLLKMVIIL